LWSHHSKIRFNGKHPQTCQCIIWQYELACFDRYRARLAEIDWNACFKHDYIDVVTERWTDILIKVACEIIPNKVVTVKPWDKQSCKGYLRPLHRAEDMANHLAKHDNTAEAWNAYLVH